MKINIALGYYKLFVCNIFHSRYHLQVVGDYGHFPHRNDILGRTNTPEEEAFLKNPAFRFDLPLVYNEDGTCEFVQNDDFDQRKKIMDNVLEGEEEE